MERITFQTTDNVTIVGDWIAGDPKKPAALLLHMMPADRTSWRPLSLKLSEAGIGSLAIDLRGHGESVTQTEVLDSARTILVPERSRGATQNVLNYKTFTDAEHQASRLDIDAALAWLKSNGCDASRVVVIGASIGANLALDAAARYTEIPKVVMLSGGLDYHGVLTEPAAKKSNVNCQMFLVASADDDYSLESHRTLATILGPRATVKEFQNAGHGTTMFASEPKLLDDIVTFVHKVSPLLSN